MHRSILSTAELTFQAKLQSQVESSLFAKSLKYYVFPSIDMAYSELRCVALRLLTSRKYYHTSSPYTVIFFKLNKKYQNRVAISQLKILLDNQ